MTPKTKITKFITPVLAVLILVSSMSYMVDFHYCQGQLKSFSLVGKAKNCHEMASKTPSCRHHKNRVDAESLACSEGDNNCCSNEAVFIESDFDKKIVSLDYLNLEFLSVGAFQQSPFYNLSEYIEDIIPYVHYKPPLILKDIPVLFESFLL